jgi:hypothetical protein
MIGLGGQSNDIFLIAGGTIRNVDDTTIIIRSRRRRRRMDLDGPSHCFETSRLNPSWFIITISRCIDMPSLDGNPGMTTSGSGRIRHDDRRHSHTNQKQ